MAKIDGVQEVRLADLVPYERNAKQHSAEQVQKIADSIKEFGFLSPLLIDKDFNIIAGHGRVMAAKQLGMETVPAVFIEGLTETQRRAYILADNKLTELGGWDEVILEKELDDLMAEGFNIDLIGFEFPEMEPDFSELEAAAEIQAPEDGVAVKIKLDRVATWRKFEEDIRAIVDKIPGASVSVGADHEN